VFESAGTNKAGTRDKEAEQQTVGWSTRAVFGFVRVGEFSGERGTSEGERGVRYSTSLV